MYALTEYYLNDMVLSVREFALYDIKQIHVAKV